MTFNVRNILTYDIHIYLSVQYLYLGNHGHCDLDIFSDPNKQVMTLKWQIL